jgi:hypothetical protein
VKREKIQESAENVKTTHEKDNHKARSVEKTAKRNIGAVVV